LPFTEEFATGVAASHSTKTVMHPSLAELTRVIDSAIHDMSAEDMTRHHEGKWSTLQILDHLNLTYIGTIKNFERCLATGKPMADPDRGSKRLHRLTVIGLGYFPRGRTSPARVEPRQNPPQEVTTQIFSNIARMDEVITESDARFGRGQPLTNHPIIGPLTAAEWRKFHLVHGKHHAKQILRLR
jgi:hypothetical protein